MAEAAVSASRQFGARVRSERRQRGWTLRALAKQASMHWTYVAQVERGERNVSLFTILRLAAALGVDPAALLQGLAVPRPDAPNGAPGETGGRDPGVTVNADSP